MDYLTIDLTALNWNDIPLSTALALGIIGTTPEGRIAWVNPGRYYALRAAAARHVLAQYDGRVGGSA